MPEPVDASIPTSTPESPVIPLSIGERQVNAAKGWAEIYADSNRTPNNSAEIALRTPAVYSREVDRITLPPELRNKWHKLLAHCDSLAELASHTPTEWGNINGLDKLQAMVYRGNVKLDFRRSVADMMEASSKLYEESAEVAPGDQKYFEGNVIAAESWLARAKAQRPS
jgi:hypothetical protein